MRLEDVKVRNLDQSEVRQVVDWAAKEGWNPGLHDADAFFAADPNGFYGYFDEKGLAGCYSLVRYDTSNAFGGFYMVRKDLRGGGVGRVLIEDVLRRAEPYNLGIDGVLHMVPKYQRSGFILSHQNARYRGVGDGDMPEDLHIIEEVGGPELETYDSRFFGSLRGKFLDAFIDQPGMVGLVSMTGDDIQGYGLMRKCRHGRKIGPLFASDRKVATSLLKGLLSIALFEPVFIDVPLNNAGAVEMVKELRMEPVFMTARLYSKRLPELPWDGIFGITTFELG